MLDPSLSIEFFSVSPVIGEIPRILRRDFIGVSQVIEAALGLDLFSVNLIICATIRLYFF